MSRTVSRASGGKAESAMIASREACAARSAAPPFDASSVENTSVRTRRSDQTYFAHSLTYGPPATSYLEDSRSVFRHVRLSQADVQLAQLLFVDGIRRSREEALRALCLRKSNRVANRF